MEAAQAAFAGWWATPAARRGQLLGRAAANARGHAGELAASLTREQGKPLREARLEIRRFVHTLEHYVGLAKNIRGGYVPDLDEGTYGLICAVPWASWGPSCPGTFRRRCWATSSARRWSPGNVVVAKPAETTPLTTLRMAEIMHRGRRLPAGVFNVVTGTGPGVARTLAVAIPWCAR